jgi:hypothetical protein
LGFDKANLSANRAPPPTRFRRRPSHLKLVDGMAAVQ